MAGVEDTSTDLTCMRQGAREGRAGNHHRAPRVDAEIAERVHHAHFELRKCCYFARLLVSANQKKTFFKFNFNEPSNKSGD